MIYKFTLVKLRGKLSFFYLEKIKFVQCCGFFLFQSFSNKHLPVHPSSYMVTLGFEPTTIFINLFGYPGIRTHNQGQQLNTHLRSFIIIWLAYLFYVKKRKKTKKLDQAQNFYLFLLRRRICEWGFMTYHSHCIKVVKM